MKVVTLKNIPEVLAPGAAEPTDGYSGPVPAIVESSGAVAIPRRAGTALSAFSGYGTRPVEAIWR